MAVKKDIILNLKKFCKEAMNSLGIEIKSAYLFGSYANGSDNKYSDIDLAVVSKSFSGFRFDDAKMLNPIVLKINSSIEVHPFKDKEFKKSNPFVKEINCFAIPEIYLR